MNEPRLRFKGFNEEWNIDLVKNIMNVSSSKRVHMKEWKKEGVPFFRARDIVSLKNDSKINDPLFISKDTYDKYSKISGIPKKNDLLVTGVGTIGISMLVKNSNKFYFKDGNIIWFHNNNKLNGPFFFYEFNTNRIQNFIKSISGIGTVATYTIQSGNDTKLAFPNIIEQQKIGSFFEKIDQLIQLQSDKLEHLKITKKGYLQKIYTLDSKKPMLRFKEFIDNWKNNTFINILNYEQPQKYIVNDDNYLKSGTPVLTANKSFILGYTKEKNIYNKGKCIIFDDFTEDYKFVDFPYMVKSSAIKILTTKENYDIKFVVGLFDITRFINEGHSRHYISIVQKQKTKTPSYKEQQKIGQLFSNIDQQITLQQQKIDNLQQQKKAYLQKMFI